MHENTTGRQTVCRNNKGSNTMEEVISIEDTARECGVPLEQFITQLCEQGLLLVIPGTEDERCDPFWGHISGCDCRFVPSPHPSVREV